MNLPLDTKKYSTAATKTQVAEALGDPALPYTERWRKALEDDRCVAILQALFAHSACSPTFALTARRIARLTGLHHQVVRRLVRGDKRRKAWLQGLVAWLAGRGRRGTRYWLSPEGAKVAELLTKGLKVGEATLRALATDRWRRKMAHSAKMAHINGTPSEIYMPYGFNYVCRQAVTSKLCETIGRGELLSPLAAKLHRDFHIVVWVANDVVQRYSTEAIEAAMMLCERRNGKVFNKAGFVIYLLREGFAQAYVEARHRARRSKWDEDFAASVEALRSALAPYGIQVDEEGYAVFSQGRLALPPDPAKAIALLRKLGLLHPEALTDRAASDQPDSEAIHSTPNLAAEALSECTDKTAEGDLNEPTDHSNKELLSAEPTNSSNEDKNDTTDLPAGTCPRCGANGDLQIFKPQPFTRPFIAADDELKRWSGKALCEACRCYLRVREGKVLFSNAAKRTTSPAGGNLTTDVGYVDTEAWLAEWAFR